LGVILEKRISEPEAQFALNLMLLPSMYVIVSEYIYVSCRQSYVIAMYSPPSK